MISSMTSFFFKEHETDFGNLIVEIKTLNSRYFELQLKLSEDLKIIEPKIRNQILTNISRGKTDFKLYLKPIEGDLDIKKIDFTQIKNLIRTSEKVSSLIKNPQPIDPLELIRLSGSKKNKYEIKKFE